MIGKLISLIYINFPFNMDSTCLTQTFTFPMWTHACPSHTSAAPRLDQCLRCEASAGQSSLVWRRMKHVQPACLTMAVMIQSVMSFLGAQFFCGDKGGNETYSNMILSVDFILEHSSPVNASNESCYGSNIQNKTAGENHEISTVFI